MLVQRVDQRARFAEGKQQPIDTLRRAPAGNLDLPVVARQDTLLSVYRAADE